MVDNMVDNMVDTQRFLSTWNLYFGLDQHITAPEMFNYIPGDYYVISGSARESDESNIYITLPCGDHYPEQEKIGPFSKVEHQCFYYIYQGNKTWVKKPVPDFKGIAMF